MKTPKICLSQCLIVRNEEKNIERALIWGKGIAQEQIVVDTGSTDRTVELARNMGAQVFSFPWTDDFSAARNFALEQASGNWIVFPDADEYFTEAEAKKLMPLLQKIHGELRADMIRIKMLNLDDDGTIISASPKDRIFRNRKELRYRYPIHEELYKDGKKLAYYDAQEELIILHTGYSQSSVEETQKGKRNIRLLEKSLEKSPEDPMLLTYLGDAYIADGQEYEAATYYQQVLVIQETHPEQVPEWAYQQAAFQLLTYLNNQKDETVRAGIDTICRGLKDNGFGMHPDVDMFMGVRSLDMERYDRALILFESALEKLSVYKGTASVKTGGMLDQIYGWLAAIYFEKKSNLAKAVKYATLSLRQNKYMDRAAQTLLKAFAAEAGDSQEVSTYWDFLGKIYYLTNANELLYLYKHAKLSKFTELENKILKALPDEIRAELTQDSK